MFPEVIVWHYKNPVTIVVCDFEKELFLCYSDKKVAVSVIIFRNSESCKNLRNGSIDFVKNICDIFLTRECARAQ